MAASGGKAKDHGTSKGAPLALVYDFDGTLIDGNMMDGVVAKELGYGDPERFWRKSNEFASEHSGDRICSYMHLLRAELEQRGRPLTLAMLKRHGSRIRLRPGLLDGGASWFDRVNKIAKKNGLRPMHFVVTSGLAEMVEAHEVSAHLERVFGSRYFYDGAGRALGPAQTVNYTTKTQYLFRINKGVHDPSEDLLLNTYMEESKRPVPFANIVFVGDGNTDIPCFSLVKKSGGHAVAVMDGTLRDDGRGRALAQIQQLVNEDRVDSVCLQDTFMKGGVLEQIVAKVAERLAS